MKNFTIISSVLISFIFAGEFIKNKMSNNSRSEDRAIGYLHQGIVETSVTNYGNFFVWRNFPSGLWGSYSYIPQLGIMVGIPGKNESGDIYPWALRMHPESDTLVYWGPTVSESWFDRTSGSYRTDWEPIEGANGQSFSGNITAGEIYGGWWNVEPTDSTPLLATSTLESTWPVNNEGIQFWPGWFDENGDHFSDQDIYLEFDDRFATRDIDSTQGYPTNVQIKLIASSSSDINLEDAVIYRARLTNESIYNYENIFVGFYYDADIASTDSLGFFWVHTNSDDMMGMDEETDMVYIYDVDGISNGATNLAYVGLMFLETPTEVGLTGFRWFVWYTRPGVYEHESSMNCCAGDGIHPVAEDKEAIQYALLSGNIDYPNQPISDWEWRGIESGPNPRESEYNEWYFHPGPDGVIDPYFDSIESLLIDYPDGLECVLFMSSGPFNILSGDSLEFSFAVVFGNDEVDLLSNAQYLNSILSISENNHYFPSGVKLIQNYPNPFNSITTITYEIKKVDYVNISIYNLNGQLVETLVNKHKTPGSYTVTWNAGEISSGLYFCKLTSNNQAITKKILLLK